MRDNLRKSAGFRLLIPAQKHCRDRPWPSTLADVSGQSLDPAALSLRATFVFFVVGWDCSYHEDHEDPTKHEKNEMDLEDQKK